MITCSSRKFELCSNRDKEKLAFFLVKLIFAVKVYTVKGAKELERVEAINNVVISATHMGFYTLPLFEPAVLILRMPEDFMSRLSAFPRTESFWSTGIPRLGSCVDPIGTLLELRHFRQIFSISKLRGGRQGRCSLCSRGFKRYRGAQLFATIFLPCPRSRAMAAPFACPFPSLPSCSSQAALSAPLASLDCRRRHSGGIFPSNWDHHGWKLRIGSLKLRLTGVFSNVSECRPIGAARDRLAESRRAVSESTSAPTVEKSLAPEEGELERLQTEANGAGPNGLEAKEQINGAAVEIHGATENGGGVLSHALDVVDDKVDDAAEGVLKESGNEDSDSVSLQLLAKEVARRRNFAIISHPDAGKTTLVVSLTYLST
jgi:hypothetical protein